MEAFFIDYFVRLEEPPSIHSRAQDDLTEIAHLSSSGASGQKSDQRSERNFRMARRRTQAG